MGRIKWDADILVEKSLAPLIDSAISHREKGHDLGNQLFSLLTILLQILLSENWETKTQQVLDSGKVLAESEGCELGEISLDRLRGSMIATLNAFFLKQKQPR